MKTIAAFLAAAAFVVACGPGDDGAAGTPARAPVPVYPEFVDADSVRLSRDMLARGDSVFHGRGVASICIGCHAREGVGSPMVRPLTNNSWHYTDGSLDGIREVTRTGVADAPSPMPPMGGATLSPEDLDAVAAYVYWISRRDGLELRQVDADVVTPPSAP